MREMGPNTISIQKFFVRCFAGSLVFHLLASWFSTGYLHADEQFQIMEFAGFKLGLTPINKLPWEFSYEMRQAIQPFIVVGLYKFLGLFHLANPFLCSFLLRLFSSVLGWASLMLLTRECVFFVESIFWKKFMIALAAFIWFIPYIQSHFSSESLSGSLFFISIALILKFKRSSRTEKEKVYFLLGAGASAGLAFVVRNQAAFLIFGMGLWCIFMGKFSFRNIVLMILPALVMVALGIVIDHWYYGKWVFTTYNYYHANIVLDKVSSFGVTPFYYYFYIYYLYLIPPFSILIMGIMFYAWIKYPKNVLTWICVPFFIVNSLIGHKEGRFFYPLVEAIPILLVLPFQKLDFGLIKKGFLKWSVVILWVLNFMLLIYFSIKPAQAVFGLYEFIYNYTKSNGQTTIISNEPVPYGISGNPVSFHRTKNIKIVYRNSIQSITEYLKDSTKGNTLVVLDNTLSKDSFQNAYPGISLVYKTWPEAVNNFTWNRQSLNRVWYAFELKL